MQIHILTLLPYTLIPILGFVAKLLSDRLSRIEQQAESSVSEPQVRQILSDKLEPIQDDIREIKHSLNGLIERSYVQNRPSKHVRTGTSNGE